MPPDDLVQGPRESLTINVATQAHRPREVEGGIARLQLVQEPQSFLRV
jgi:hypothetical protein